MQAALLMGLGVNPMQRFSALVRYIFTAILLPILIAVAAHFIEEQPQETANVVLKFLFDLAEQTWFRVTALLLVGFAAGLWVDWFLRRLDGSRVDERKKLGTDMVSLGHDLRFLRDPTTPILMQRARPQILSCFTAARKFAIWVPDQRAYELHPDRARNMITDYLMGVGTLLKDGQFREAKRYAVNSKASFDKAYAELRKL